MFKNAFANLQKVGKSLMLPVSVLPIAGILLGVGSANFSWLPAVVSHVMAEAGGSVFANMPLIFAIGVALGFTNNDGVSALAAVVAYGIMVKTGFHHDAIGNNRCQRRNAVIIGKAQRHTNSENQRHVGEHRSTRFCHHMRNHCR